MAIKCVRKNKRMSVTRAEQDALLEEAKSMLEINKYHDNIVNLQGIAYQKSAFNDDLLEVYLINILFHFKPGTYSSMTLLVMIKMLVFVQ